VDNNYLDLGMNKSGFVHTLPSGRFKYTDVRFLIHEEKKSLVKIHQRSLDPRPKKTKNNR
jgi:hypothetical protein